VLNLRQLQMTRPTRIFVQRAGNQIPLNTKPA
jgi:hypothetical protein